MKLWSSVDEVHTHALKAVKKPIKDLVSKEALQSYYQNPNNKGWIGNSIESDWFGVKNNTKQEADIPYLNLEIKVTPIRKTRNGWSAKERLVLNIFSFHDEPTRNFVNSSFLEKANLIELVYYEYLKDKVSPELVVKAATLFNLNKLPEDDLLIIEQDWNTIVNKIKEGKAEELSDSLTKYLAASTKGGKTKRNLTTQPYSDKKAHRRAFTLKGSYMTQVARKVMGIQNEKIVKNPEELKKKSFEEIIIHKYKPFIGKTKKELAKHFSINIPEKDDKASTAILASKMLNLDGDIQNSEEFIKADISIKTVVVESGKQITKEGFKINIPDNTIINPKMLVDEDWLNSLLRDYLSTYQFMLVIFEKTETNTIFKGVKFWHVPYEDLEGDISRIWNETRQIFIEGVELTYTEWGKNYRVLNNLPESSNKKILHVRPSADNRSYKPNKDSMNLPFKSKWINRPSEKLEILTDFYMTKQAWWLNNDYMYEQVKEFFIK